MPAAVIVTLLGFLLAQVHLATFSPVSVSVESKKNENGLWITKVGLEHRKTYGQVQMSTDIREGDETIAITTTISRPYRARTPGYTLYPGLGSYKFHTNGTTWPNARLACEEEGAHLVIINSEREADVMAQLFARYPKPMINAAGNDDWAWVGAHTLGINGEYYTVFGEPLNTTGFIRWVKGQPDDKDVGTALVTHRATGGLGDAFPTWTASFICEMEL